MRPPLFCAGHGNITFARLFRSLGWAALVSIGLLDGTRCAVAGDESALPCAFFVAVTGSDRSDGTTASTPFASLEKAQAAMRASNAKVACLRGGLYKRTAALMLTASDNGETWQYYAPDGIDSAVLDGGGATDLMEIAGSSKITINGLTLRDFRAFGIHTRGGWTFRLPATEGNIIENCDIGRNVVTNWNSGAVFTEGASPRTTIRNNYVHDLGSQGIALSTWFRPDESIDGSVIENNIVLDTVQRMSDGGGVYIGMHGGSQTSHVTVRHNFVRDYGASGVTGAVGIYLDDNASNVTVTGNVVGPPKEGSVGTGNLGAGAFEVHNGNNNVISGNIVDLGDSGRVISVLWYHGGEPVEFGMAGNTFTGNIILSDYPGRQHVNFGGVSENSYFQNLGPASNFKIADNLYFNRGGGIVNTHGPIASDTNPVFADPRISGWTYAVGARSPAFASPVNFVGIAGGWGPPGFVIPRDGTKPSVP